MAESSEQEKTEEATPKKRQEAMDEGRIPRSIELQSAAFLLAAAFVVNFVAPIVSTHMVGLFGSGLRAIGSSSGSPAGMLDLLQGTGRELLLIVAALAGALSLSALAVGALQPNGDVVPEPRFDVKHVADAVLFIAGLPLNTNVQFMNVMATTMPFIGRG